MRKLKIIISLLLLCFILISQAKAAAPIKYRTLFDIKNSYCAIKTKGVIGQDNREWAYEGRGFGTASTAAMLMMENGQNEISIEFGSLNWFDEEIKEEKLRTEFNPKASCKAELYRFEGDNQQVLGTITVTINDKGVPEAKEADV